MESTIATLAQNKTGGTGRGGRMSLILVAKSRVVSTGRIFFAVGLIVIGYQHFLFGQFIPMVVPWWPGWIPGCLFWVYLVGAVGEPDRSRKGLLQFAHGAWTDALSCRVVPQDLGVSCPFPVH
jgi:hypothetical protein